MKKRGFMRHPVVDESKCSGCRKCIDTCGNECLGFDEIRKVAYVKTPYDCTAEFRKCISGCPAGAIYFPDEEEYFAYVKQRLQWLESVFGPRAASPGQHPFPLPSPSLPSEKPIDKTAQ
ncbi:MAG: ferredoxin family protein [Geobacter sp.]|nr:ferredoxin family protein [Geobacter sp.]